MNNVLLFSVRYVPLVSGGPVGEFGSELYPLRVDMFGTHELATDRQTIVFSQEATEHKFQVVVRRGNTGIVPQPNNRLFWRAGAYEQQEDTSSADTFSPSAAVIMNMYCNTYTKTKQRCWTTAGTAVLTLATLASATERGATLELAVWQNRDNSFPDGVATTVEMSSKHALLKGRLFVERVQLMSDIRFRAPTRYDVDARIEIATQAARTLCLMIDRGMQMFFGAGKKSTALGRPSAPFLSPFHVPEYRTPRMPLPSSAYAMLMPDGQLNELYFEQLFEVALRRANMTRAQALALVGDAGSKHERCAFAALCVRAVSVQAVSLCYLDDFLNRNKRGATRYNKELIEGDEDFKIARLCGADDCEGVALEVSMHVRQLSAHKGPLSPLLDAARTLLRQYVPTLLLGCVTNVKMTAAQLDQQCALAHTFCGLLPRPFCAQIANGVKVPGLSWCGTAEWPVLFAEGTAPIDPVMQPVATYYPPGSRELQEALRAAADRRVVGDLIYKTLADHGVEYANLEVFSAPDRAGGGDYSSFYKWVMSGAVAEFAGQRKLDWAFVDKQRQTFGVRADWLLAQKHDAIELVSFLEYSKEEARLCDAVLEDQQPIPNLTRQTEAGSALLPELPQTPGAAPSGTVLHQRRTFVTVRRQDIDSKLLRAVAELKRNDKIRAISHALYTLHQSVTGDGAPNQIVDIYFDF